MLLNSVQVLGKLIHLRAGRGRRAMAARALYRGARSPLCRYRGCLLCCERLIIEGEIEHHHQEIPCLSLEILGMALERRHLLEAEVRKDPDAGLLPR